MDLNEWKRMEDEKPREGEWIVAGIFHTLRESLGIPWMAAAWVTKLERGDWIVDDFGYTIKWEQLISDHRKGSLWWFYLPEYPIIKGEKNGNTMGTRSS